jgi:hypothetical protein
MSSVSVGSIMPAGKGLQPWFGSSRFDMVDSFSTALDTELHKLGDGIRE